MMNPKKRRVITVEILTTKKYRGVLRHGQARSGRIVTFPFVDVRSFTLFTVSVKFQL